ncbi:thioesterase II family protein [Providencia vermicola]|uniref:thioesterase II family protein n=1 Tax=Providencia vermicola TaxID=333965 RepID=UPI0034DD8B6E
MMINSSVFPYHFKSKANAVIDSVCFPSAGGNAAMYNKWNDITPDWLNICPVEYPGHGSRLKEALVNDPEIIIDEITNGIINKCDKKIAVFGHSVGSIIALQVVKQLQKQNHDNPLELIILSGRPETSMLSRRPKGYHLLPKEEFLKVISVYEGIPEELINNPEILDFFLPILRNDFQLNDKLSDVPPISIDIPVMAFYGERDSEIINHDAINKWATYTTEWLGSYTFPGGHFYLNQPVVRKMLLDTIVTRLKNILEV